MGDVLTAEEIAEGCRLMDACDDSLGEDGYGPSEKAAWDRWLDDNACALLDAAENAARLRSRVALRLQGPLHEDSAKCSTWHDGCHCDRLDAMAEELQVVNAEAATLRSRVAELEEQHDGCNEIAVRDAYSARIQRQGLEAEIERLTGRVAELERLVNSEAQEACATIGRLTGRVAELERERDQWKRACQTADAVSEERRLDLDEARLLHGSARNELERSRQSMYALEEQVLVLTRERDAAREMYAASVRMGEDCEREKVRLRAMADKTDPEFEATVARDHRQ